MKKIFDLFLSLLLIPFLFPVFVFIAILVKVASPGPILYWSNRIGKNNQIFSMPKFRSMKVQTPAVATHLLANPDSVLTPIGKIIRTTSLDEIPQLWCVLRGDMSFVGPRPALFNQYDLIHLRTDEDIDTLLPGVTGWAQVNGRDELSIPDKVSLDSYYLKNKCFMFDIKILWLTFINVIYRKGVSH